MKTKKELKTMSDKLSTQILDQIPTPVMAVTRELEVFYMNQAALTMLGKDMDTVTGEICADLFCSRHCNTPDCRMKMAINTGEKCTARNEITLDGQKVPIEYFAVPLKDDSGEIIGGLEYILDITDQIKHEDKLKEQSKTIQEISTPTIKLWDGIVILPIIGIIDSNRAQHMMEKMLEKIVTTSAKVIILDISGVLAVDTAVANHLIKITKATQLMGCTCIISGISPAVAQTIVQLGVEMDGIITKSTLSDALAQGFSLVNLKVIDM
ncbi:MAG: PAS domain-containing protein [Spirochaetaceae bacterium]